LLNVIVYGFVLLSTIFNFTEILLNNKDILLFYVSLSIILIYIIDIISYKLLIVSILFSFIYFLAYYTYITNKIVKKKWYYLSVIYKSNYGEKLFDDEKTLYSVLVPYVVEELLEKVKSNEKIKYISIIYILDTIRFFLVIYISTIIIYFTLFKYIGIFVFERDIIQNLSLVKIIFYNSTNISRTYNIIFWISIIYVSFICLISLLKLVSQNIPLSSTKIMSNNYLLKFDTTIDLYENDYKYIYQKIIMSNDFERIREDNIKNSVYENFCIPNFSTSRKYKYVVCGYYVFDNGCSFVILYIRYIQKKEINLKISKNSLYSVNKEQQIMYQKKIYLIFNRKCHTLIFDRYLNN